jgi:hypothetical protein
MDLHLRALREVLQELLPFFFLEGQEYRGCLLRFQPADDMAQEVSGAPLRSAAPWSMGSEPNAWAAI